MGSAAGVDAARFASKEELTLLLQRHEPMYAVLDAARDPGVSKLVHDADGEVQSLYNGRRGEQLATVAPYLARMPVGSRLFEGLVRDGWGHNWGILVTCDVSFDELRRHLRRLLVVQNEERQALYFRFYDPRVLVPFLGTATDEERRTFFGPVSAFLVEGQSEGTMLRWVRVGAAAPPPAAPWDLLTIRDAQMAVFSRELVEGFIHRMEVMLGPTLANLNIRATIRDEIERAHHYGIVSESGMERYLTLTVALGPTFDERVSWARAELLRADTEERCKLRRLERRLRWARRQRSAKYNLAGLPARKQVQK